MSSISVATFICLLGLWAGQSINSADAQAYLDNEGGQRPDGPLEASDMRRSAFQAVMWLNMTNPTVGNVVVFDRTLTNVGGDYNKTTGYFVAPSTGVYSFNLAASSPTKARSSKLHLHLMRNTRIVGRIHLNGNAEMQRSINVVMVLNRGDKVYAQIGLVDGTVTLAGIHTTLNGYRII